MTERAEKDEADWHVQGDMRLDAELAAHGWCWCRARPEARRAVELLVNGRVVATGVADLPRPDLQRLGIGDGRHGFHIRLSRSDFDAGTPCIVSARAREGGMIFGQLRQDPPRALPAPPRERQIRGALDSLSERLAGLARRAGAPGRPAALREAAAMLAPVLRARQGGADGAGVVAARATLAHMAAGLALPAAPWPRLSLVLAPAAQVGQALRCLRTVAEVPRVMAAEILLAWDGADASCALLVSVIPGLRLFAARAGTAPGLLAAASGVARGAWLALVGPATEALSASALERHLAALDAAGLEAGKLATGPATDVLLLRRGAAAPGGWS